MTKEPSQSAPPAAPRVEDYFPREGLLRVLRRGHPYDTLGTYELLAALYGYRTAYVNFGWWPDGPETDEPGRQLAELAADALDLHAGGRLIDVGSGLGQASLDLLRRHELASVLGVNRSERQLAYANALAQSAGLGDRIRHEHGDASTFLGGLEPASYDGVLALECVGHFPDPDAFLVSARRALCPGGRIAFTLNVVRRPATGWERALFRASFGFVPQAVDAWTGRLDRAGFTAIETRDLTAGTVGALSEVCLSRLQDPSPELLDVPVAVRLWIRSLFRAMRRAVRRGVLGYALISAAA